MADIYSHVSTEMRQVVVNKLDAIALGCMPFLLTFLTDLGTIAEYYG